MKLPKSTCLGKMTNLFDRQRGQILVPFKNICEDVVLWTHVCRFLLPKLQVALALLTAFNLFL
jgi:hypothetical protein